MTAQMNKEMEADGIQLTGPVMMDFVLVLEDDETFNLDMDGTGFADSFKAVIAEEGPALIKKMLADQGVTEDMYGALAEQSGYADFDEFMAAVIDEMTAGIDEEYVAEMQENAHLDGHYVLDGDKIELVYDSDDTVLSDHGTINKDGSIDVTSRMETGELIELTFNKVGGAEKTEAKTEETKADAQASAKLEPGVLLDDAYVKVEWTGFGESIMGQQLTMNFENKTDKKISVMAQNFAANGMMMDSMLLAEIDADDTVEDGLTIYSAEDLERAGIKDLEKDLVSTAWTFHVYDTDSYETIEDVEISLGDTSFEAPDYTDGMKMLVDDDNIQIAYEKMEDGVIGTELTFAIKNKTDKMIILQTKEVTVDGEEVSPLMAEVLRPGTRATGSMTFFSSDLENLGISDFEDEADELGITFNIMDSAEWDTIENVDAKLEF